MSTTLLRTRHDIAPDIAADIAPDIAWEVPTGILHHAPPPVEDDAELLWPEHPGEAPPAYLHPFAVAGAAAGYAWFLLVFWAVFSGDGYIGFVLFVASLVSCIMLGLLGIGGGGGRNVAPWQRHWRSFSEFLGGQVQVWGARISGREAFIQLVGAAWCLAALATAFGIIIVLSRP